jgi:hypothetical protein
MLSGEVEAQQVSGNALPAVIDEVATEFESGARVYAGESYIRRLEPIPKDFLESVDFDGEKYIIRFNAGSPGEYDQYTAWKRCPLNASKCIWMIDSAMKKRQF